MPENHENNETNYNQQERQVLAVDPNRLRVVKINNVSGNAYIKGTNQPQIVVHGGTIGTGRPFIKLKQEGEKAEISAAPSIPGVQFGPHQFRIMMDRDMADQPPFEDFDAGEDYDREAARDARRQMREYARRVKEQVREATSARRGFPFRFGFDPDELGDLVSNISRTVTEAIGGLGDLYIEVPAGVDLEIKSVSGNLKVENIRGYCRMDTTLGHTQLENLRGGVRVKGVSGDIEGRALAGEFEAKLMSGSVKLVRCELSALDMSITSGRVLLDTILAGPNSGDYKIRSTSAHVQFNLPETSDATIDCRTLSGRLEVYPADRPADVRNRPGQTQARIDLNGGRRQVSINTISGNIRINLYNESETRNEPNFDGEWPVAPERPAPPPPPPSPAGFGAIPPVPPVGFGAVPPVVPPVGFGTVPPVPPVPPVPTESAWQSEAGPETPNWPAAESSAEASGWPAANATPRQEVASEQATSGESAGRDAAATAASDGSDQSQVEPDRKSRQYEILQAIERGEISVEEGLARLGELED